MKTLLTLFVSLALCGLAQAELYTTTITRTPGSMTSFDVYTTKVASDKDIWTISFPGITNVHDAGTERTIPYGSRDEGVVALTPPPFGGGGGGGGNKDHGPAGDTCPKILLVHTDTMVTETFYINLPGWTGSWIFSGTSKSGFFYSSDTISKASAVTPGTGSLSPFHWLVQAKAM